MRKSVVMALYNGEKYLTEQLDSIREQSRKVDEVIMCDDGSSDNTVAIAQKYIADYNLQDSWHVHVNETNLGYANNFKHIAELATGELIFFSDQDDVWDLDKVQIMEDIMLEHEDCAVLATDYVPWYSDEPERMAPQKVLDKMPNNGVLEKINLSAQSLYIGAIGCCMCVRSTFIERIKPYWFDGWAQDDRMWRLAQCVDGLYILHSDLIHHRIHANNTSTYGKYHTVAGRCKLFGEMSKAAEQMHLMLEDVKADNRRIEIVKNHACVMDSRVKLIKERQYLRGISLLFLLKYYQERKSFFVDFYVAIKKRGGKQDEKEVS